MLKIWFMYDNHTFGRIKMGDRDELIAQAHSFFAEDGCGSIFVKDGNASMDALTLHGHEMSKGRWGRSGQDIAKWADAVLVEEAFRKAMAA